MKKTIGIILSIIVALTVVSCDDSTFELGYKAPLTIEFAGIDYSNIVTVEKGVISYTAQIGILAPETGVKTFEIFNADAKTGAKGTLIGGTSVSFSELVPSYSVEYTFINLIVNKCIKVVVSDMKGNVYERNLFVKITPAVLFSQSVKMETAEVYYGPYYATWLYGRVYMRGDGEKYKDEIDFSLGDVVIASEGAAAVPALVNPAVRGNNNLLTINGLQQTKFELTVLTKAQFDAINEVDGSSISSLADPAQDAVKLVSGKVYLFKTANGKKGLIYIATLTLKTGTIENVAGEWIINSPYSLASLTAKVMQQ
ncbi:MAG: hypothetical protein NT144_08130 [Bacteroidia bacterium]|nr:hypothetical protein [Bacteroidia bacterium]